MYGNVNFTLTRAANSGTRVEAILYLEYQRVCAFVRISPPPPLGNRGEATLACG
jgi:hypothetical protein